MFSTLKVDASDRVRRSRSIILAWAILLLGSGLFGVAATGSLLAWMQVITGVAGIAAVAIRRQNPIQTLGSLAPEIGVRHNRLNGQRT